MPRGLVLSVVDKIAIGLMMAVASALRFADDVCLGDERRGIS